MMTRPEVLFAVGILLAIVGMVALLAFSDPNAKCEQWTYNVPLKQMQCLRWTYQPHP